MKKRLRGFSVKSINKYDFIKSITPVALITGLTQLLILLYMVLNSYTGYINNYITNCFDESSYLSAFILYDDFTLLIEVAALFSGLIAGTAQFSFLHSKKQSTALMSFALKRKKLLKSRVLSGLLILFLSLLLPLLIALFLNFRLFGATIYVFQSFFVLLLVLTEATVLGFACASLGSVLSSRTDESAIFSVSLAFLPKLLITVVNGILKIGLYGFSDLSSIAAYFDPLKNLILDIYGHYSSSDSLLVAAGYQRSDYPWSTNFSDYRGDIIATAVWLLFLLAVCFLLPLLFKRRYVAENAGCRACSHTVNTVIQSVCCGTVMMIDLYLCLYQWTDITEPPVFGEWKYVLSASVCGGLAALFASFLLHFDLKKMLKSLIVFPLYTAAPLLLLCLGFGGFFGFSGRLPNADAVESVQISLPFDGALAEGNFGSRDAFNRTYMMWEGNFESSSKNDVKLAEMIHKTALSHREKESNAMLEITYNLKNGGTLSRVYYLISNETESSTLALFKSDTAKKYRQDLLIGSSDRNSKAPADDNQEVTNSYNNKEDYKTAATTYDNKGSVLYLKNHCGEITEIKSMLTKDQYNALKEALCKDLETITVQELFTPAKKEACTLSFTQIEEKDGKGYNFTGGFLFPVYDSMKNTIAILKQAGLEKYFTEGKKYTKIRLVNLEDLCAEEKNEQNSSSSSIKAVPCCRPYFSEILPPLDEHDLKESTAITDQAKMALIYENCFADYYTRGGGKLAVVTYNDSSEKTFFVPNSTLEKIK